MIKEIYLTEWRQKVPSDQAIWLPDESFRIIEEKLICLLPGKAWKAN